MRYTYSPTPNCKWFYKLDLETNPAQIMLYQFVGAKFEAHCFTINNTEEIMEILEKIYPIAPLREAILNIIFQPSYADHEFERVLEKLCKLRDELKLKNL